MKNRLKRLIVAIVLAGAVIGSLSVPSFAAGFWNYTPYTVHVHFTPESCPWVLRWACGTFYSLPPYENGIPGSASTNNTAGTVALGGVEYELLEDKNGKIRFSYEYVTIEIGPQDYINFALEGDSVRIRAHRSDTKVDEYFEMKLAN